MATIGAGRRFTTVLLAFALALGACGGEPPCGVDEDGEDIPVCMPEIEGVPDVLEFCPGDSWATPACESCSCLPDGSVFCGLPADDCP
jgi:hypothetical protein